MSKGKAQLKKSKSTEDEYFDTLADASGSEAEEDNDENSENENDGDEKEKKPIKIKTIVRKPQPKLDPTRLCGQRGLDCLLQTFEKFKSKGENNEFQDLNNMIAKYEYWSHRLFPKMKFVDIIERLEKLGEKREVKNKMNTLRMGASNENENQENDPALEDEAMTAKVMDMMKNVSSSESGDENNHDYKPKNANTNKNNKVIDEEDEVERITNETNTLTDTNKKTNKVIHDDEEDEDELFNRLLNEHNILKNI